MFSGIVEETATVISLVASSQGARLAVQSSLEHASTKPGDSIAIEGVCLTVAGKKGAVLHFDIGSESLRRTTLGSLKVGRGVNLERAVLLTDRVHGHLVTGHVDGIATLKARSNEGDTLKLTFGFEKKLSPLIAVKGAIALSGVSLTVGEVSNESFDIYVIPHTLEKTTLADIGTGGAVNIEVDLLARYVQRVLTGGAAPAREAPLIDAEWKELLSRSGFIDPAGRS